MTSMILDRISIFRILGFFGNLFVCFLDFILDILDLVASANSHRNLVCLGFYFIRISILDFGIFRDFLDSCYSLDFFEI